MNQESVVHYKKLYNKVGDSVKIAERYDNTVKEVSSDLVGIKQKLSSINQGLSDYKKNKGELEKALREFSKHN
jgi:hypothetical protein